MGSRNGRSGGQIQPLSAAEVQQHSTHAATQPVFIRKDTLDCFQWRIRNLPYPEEAYLLEVDADKQEVVIKTTVKKYYKRFDIPDLKRLNIKLDKAPLSFTYKNNTLIVSVTMDQSSIRSLSRCWRRK